MGIAEGIPFPDEAAFGARVREQGVGAAREKSRNFGLDAVRATAITGVLVAHFTHFAAVSIGARAPAFIGLLGNGVELFFALSGFLIGGLLFDIAEKPSLHAFVVFMVRRWMRTIPLYFSWLAMLLIVWTPERDPVDHAIQFLTFSQNLFWPPRDAWFAVSWSLTIEEWFYLLFSATLIGLTVVTGRKAIIAAAAVFIGVPLVLRAALAGPDLPAVWFETFRKIAMLRLDAIAYGVAVAALVRFRPDAMRRLSIPCLFAGAGMVIGTTISGLPLYILAMYPAGLALCLPAAIRLPRPSGIVAALIQWLSTRSYGIYMIHFSLLDFSLAAAVQGVIEPWSVPLIAGAGTIVLAELSFRYVETPILTARPRQ